MEPVADILPEPAARQAVWVLLPAYNEGEGLLRLCRDLLQTLPGADDYVLVIDDGSTDGSIERLQQELGPERLLIQRHPENRGLGAALQTGFEFVCTRESLDPDCRIIVMDADRTHPPTLIPALMTLSNRCDVVIASRYQPGAKVIGLSQYRQFLSVSASWLFRLCVPVRNVRDYTCGYRAYRLSILQRAFARYQANFITETGFTCMAEVLIKLARIGATFQELPLILHYDYKVSTSKMKLTQTTLCSLWLLFRYRYRNRTDPS